MSFSLKKTLRVVLPLGISALLLFYAFRDIHWDEMLRQFSQADYRWVFVSAIFGLLSHASRAHRWQQLLGALGYRTSFWNSFHTVMTGYFVNLIFPRAGEVSRCGMMSKLDQVPMSTALGTVILERVVDVFMLFSLIFILLAIEFQTMQAKLFEFFENKIPSGNNLVFTLGFILGLIILIVILRKLFWGRLAQLSLIQKITEQLKNVWQGMGSIRKVKNKGLFIFHTLFIWLMYYCMSFVLFYSFPETAQLDFWFGYIVLILGGLGMAAPVQGGIGAYHLLVGWAFSLRGIEEGIIYSTYMHTSQTLLILIGGGFSFVWVMLAMARQKKKMVTK